MKSKLTIATRGSALALAQSNKVLAQCRVAVPATPAELKIIRTTGDKLQTASMARPAPDLPKGLFTKELEMALLRNEADLAVHSLKDLPTELPAGLILGAIGEREDVRDVLVLRESSPLFSRACKSPGSTPSVDLLPEGMCVGTSSTRRQAQLLAGRPGLTVTEIRGNVLTRLQKLSASATMDGTILAAAGLARLGYTIDPEGLLRGEGVPDRLHAILLDLDFMLPCVGQAAIGIEIRDRDPEMNEVCERLDHAETRHCVLAERSFLRAMGGGCQSPVAAVAEIGTAGLRLRAVSFVGGVCRRGELSGSVEECEQIGQRMADLLKK